MKPRNGGSGRFWRILVAIVLLAVVAIGVVALFPPARQPVGQPSTLNEDDDWEAGQPASGPSPVTKEDDGSQDEFEQPQPADAPAPSPSTVTEEDDGSQDEFERPLSDTGESLPNGAPANDTPSVDDK